MGNHLDDYESMGFGNIERQTILGRGKIVKKKMNSILMHDF